MSNRTVNPLVYAISLTHDIPSANTSEITEAGDHVDMTYADIARIVNMDVGVFEAHFLADDDTVYVIKFNEYFTGIKITSEYTNKVTQYNRLQGDAVKYADEYRKDYAEYLSYLSAKVAITRPHLTTLFNRQQESLDHLLDELIGVDFGGFNLLELLAELRDVSTDDDMPF